MRFYNTPANDFTFPMVFSACAELDELEFGEMVHGFVVKCGDFGWNSAVGSSMVYMYSKCGRMRNARKVFDEMCVRDVVAWTAVVVGYLRNGESEKSLECVRLMHRVGEEDMRPNYRTLEGGFQACCDVGGLVEGRCLHGWTVKIGYGFCYDVQSSILCLYSKLGSVGECWSSFCEVGNKDVVCWTSVIASYARLGCVNECLDLFWRMQDDAGVFPDEIVIGCVISLLGDAGGVREGKAFHGLIIRRNYVRYQVVHRGLISMYCRFGLLGVAQRIFDDTVQERDSETWNLMMFECAKARDGLKCMLLFREMLHEKVECSSSSLISVISSCSQLGYVHLGKSVHCFIIKFLLDDNVSICNSLIDMYGKCGNLSTSRSIFGRIQKDAITWSTMISAYAHIGELDEELALFDEMILEGVTPNSSTLVTVLSACSRLASLEKGMKIHNYINTIEIALNTSIETALVDMYGKCGQLERSREIFDSMIERDVVSWNVMISCYGMHGDARAAIEVFKQLEDSCTRPNELTFLAVLQACSHSGLVEEGKYYFHKLRSYSLTPTLKHYACLIDLLGKSGNLQEAEDVVMSMPIKPDGGLWGALLSACKIHNEVEVGLRIAKRAIEADPENDGFYITLLNMLDSTGKWKEAEGFRELMKEKGVKKRLGWSAL